MIKKIGFLVLLLLCWPFVSMAGILESVENASTELRSKFDGLIEGSGAQYANASDEEKAKAEEQILTAIDEAKKEAETPCPEEAETEQPAEEPKKCPKGITDPNYAYPNCHCINEDMIYKPELNDCVENRVKQLQEAYDEAHEKEQSLANRTLTAVTIAATGIGGMELARGLAEQSADKAAEQDMAAYLATFRCTYGDGHQVKAGPEEIELPGGNDATMMSLRNEYFTLASDLKKRKEALGLTPGIESETILDKSEMGLYDDENVGIENGVYASLYRAQMLGSEEDQKKIDEEQKASKNRVIGGAVAAGVGVVGSMVGNSLINGKLSERLKQAIAEKKVGKETQALLKKETKALEDLRSCLKSAGISETEKLSFSNFYPSILSVKSINCKKDLLPVSGNKLSSGYAPNTIKASNMFADSTDETEIYSKILTHINIETVSKLVGYSFSSTANLTTEQTNIKNKIKTSIESVQKKFKEAEEKDKKSAEKAGISIGNISGSADGSGLASRSSLFSGMNFDSLTGGSSFLSSFMNK